MRLPKLSVSYTLVRWIVFFKINSNCILECLTMQSEMLFLKKKKKKKVRMHYDESIKGPHLGPAWCSVIVFVVAAAAVANLWLAIDCKLIFPNASWKYSVSGTHDKSTL